MNSIKMRGVFAAVSGALMFGAASVATADTTDDLLKALRDKGVLSQDEFDNFNASRDTEKVKKMSEIKTSFKDGIVWKSGDGSFQMSINGRIQADYRSFDAPNSTAAGVLKTDNTKSADTFDIRRAYLTVKGTFFNNINFEATRDGSDVKYMWLELAYIDQAKVRFGQFKMPFGLEQLTSSRFLDFTERSTVAYIAPGVDRGIMVHGVPMKGLSYAVAVGNGSQYADQGQNAVEANNGHDGKEWMARGTANISQLAGIDNSILHVGVDYAKSNDLNSGKQSFRTDARGITFFETAAAATYAGADQTRYALEGIASYGPVKLQSEYGVSKIEPTTGSSKEIKAWYASLNWMITGESYSDAYKDGVMDRMRPKNDFVALGAPGFGAWEAGIRYAKFDAKDFIGNAGATGTADFDTNKFANDVNSWTAGIKWILNPNTRLMLDYIKTDFDHAINSGSTVASYDSEKALNFRAQFDF